MKVIENIDGYKNYEKRYTANDFTEFVECRRGSIVARGLIR